MRGPTNRASVWNRVLRDPLCPQWDLRVAYRASPPGERDIVVVPNWFTNCAVFPELQALGIAVRAGLHTGEVEIRGDDIGGNAVHIGARVSALADANDVVVSSTLRDLVIGSTLEFDDHGHQLEGVRGEWRLFAVAST